MPPPIVIPPDDDPPSGGRPPVTYSQRRDDEYGSVTGVPYATYQISSLGSVTILSRPEAPARPDYTPDGPGAPGDNGYNPATGLPWGVRAEGDKFYYQGKRVNRDGSLWTGTDPVKVNTEVLTRADGSKVLINSDTGEEIKQLSPAAGVKQPTSGSSGGYGGVLGGGGSSGPVRDYLGEQTAQNAWQMEYLKAQQEFQAAQAALGQNFQGDQNAQERAQQTYENALNRLQQTNQQVMNIASQWGLQGSAQDAAAKRDEAQRAFDAIQSDLNKTFSAGMQASQQQMTAYENAQNRLADAAQQANSLASQWGMQANQLGFQGNENALNRALDASQFGAQMSAQQRSDALNRNMSNSQFAAKYGIDKANVEMARQKLSLDAAAQYSAQMQDFDPAAAIAFNEMGGGSIANAMAGGGDALSQNALHGASLTKRTMDQGWTPLGEYQYTEETVPAYQAFDASQFAPAAAPQWQGQPMPQFQQYQPGAAPTFQQYQPGAAPTFQMPGGGGGERPGPFQWPGGGGGGVPTSGQPSTSSGGGGSNLGLPEWLLALINSPQPGMNLPPPPPPWTPAQGAPVASTGGGGGGFTPPAAPVPPPGLGDYEPAPSPSGTPNYTGVYKGDGGSDDQYNGYRPQSPYSAYDAGPPLSDVAPVYTGPNGKPFQQVTGSTDAAGNFVAQYGDWNPGTSSYQGSGGGAGIPGWSISGQPTQYFSPPQQRTVVPELGRYG